MPSFIDNFTVTTDEFLYQHSPDTGTAWVLESGNQEAFLCRLYAGVSSLRGGPFDNAFIRSDDLGDADCYVEAVHLDTTMLVCLRVQDIDNFIGFYKGGGGGAGMRLVKVVAGVTTNLITMQPVAGNTYRIEAEGTTIRFYENGVQQGSNITVTEFQSETKQGVIAFNNAGASRPFLDSYAAGVLSSGGISITTLINLNHMVGYTMKKNVAGQTIGAQMITISDGSNFTGTVAAEVTVDGGTKTSGGGTVTHEGEGYHSYAPTQAETNGNHVAVSFTGSGALSQTIQVYTAFPQTVDNNTAIAALNNFDPASDAVANVTLVSTTTTNTDMRGTDSANTVTPPTVSEFNARSLPSADYFIVSDYTAPANANITSILADTNELQTDWTNGGRLDILLDAIPTTAMRGTDSANTVVPPSVAQFNARTIVSADYFVTSDYTVPPTTSQISTAVWSEATRALTDKANFTVDVLKINGRVIAGNGNGTPFNML